MNESPKGQYEVGKQQGTEERPRSGLTAFTERECQACGDTPADVADLVTEVQDGDADLPDAFLLVWPEGSKQGRFTSCYESEDIARDMAQRLGARVVQFVPAARPIDLTPMLEHLKHAPPFFRAFVDGWLSSVGAEMAREFIRKARAEAAADVGGTGGVE